MLPDAIHESFEAAGGGAVELQQAKEFVLPTSSYRDVSILSRIPICGSSFVRYKGDYEGLRRGPG
jgi:hypothetical protein